ncbi:hypothetical protein AYO44_09855 [Planctomycetaceae bacterium SCGC AG-212-F19]|nr:hypothetical protein AYO44_09855 [Planctomycetaceae bacterium SCGC AG-212-F19]
MPEWQGNRLITVVSACMAADGTPTFALNEVEVRFDEYEKGVHYDLVEELLQVARYEEPYVHFDENEAPHFLIAAVTELLVARWSLPEPITEIVEEC